MGWQDETRRALIGEKVELQSVGGKLWIRPKKLSTDASDELKKFGRRLLGDKESRDRVGKLLEMRSNPERLEELRKRIQGNGYEKLSEEEREEFLEYINVSQLLEGDDRTELYRLVIRDGIGEHNFEDDAGKLINGGKSFDEKTVEEILAWDDLATEIFEAINGYSRPLAERSSVSSETSPDGSSTASTPTRLK